MPPLAALFDLSEVLGFGAIAALLVGAALYTWPWARRGGRSAGAAAASVIGWTAWNLVLSGVGAVLFTALALGLFDRNEPAGRVVGAAALAGAVAALFDLFVL